MSVLTQKPKTLVDVYRLLPEGTPIQVINNQFYMSPSPNFQHFDILDKISDALKEEVKKQNSGRVFFAPLDIFLGEKSAVQPDIFFISTANNHLIKEDGIYGSPDFIVEVLSPRNRNADLVKKRALYEQFGVKEYFVVEPSDKTVLSFYLKDGKYSEPKKQKSKFTSKLLNKTFTF
jgi:Uma2 family endonuclease